MVERFLKQRSALQPVKQKRDALSMRGFRVDPRHYSGYACAE
jgi:hypothetical protein